MSRLEVVTDAVEYINDAAAEVGCELGVHVVFSGWYTAILIGDHNLWDDEDNKATCDRCESDQPGAHECPDDTAEGLAEVLRVRIREYAADLLVLAGEPTPTRSRP